MDVSGNPYASHCGKGEYRVLGMYDFRVAHMMLSRREADVARKRSARAAATAAARAARVAAAAAAHRE